MAGLGALYAAPDGTVYQVQGLAEDLDGLYADEELHGFAEEEELRGFAEEEELRGLDEDEELRGFAEEEALRGLAEDEELRGFEQGYVRETRTAVWRPIYREATADSLVRLAGRNPRPMETPVVVRDLTARA